MIGRFLIAAFLTFALWQGLSAQDPRPSATQLEEMKKLNFLVGEWSGEGWTEFVPGQRRTSPIHEMVQPRLGGVVLLVEGLGKVKVPGKQEEVITHNALGVLSYDEKAKIYRLRSYIANGQSTDAEAKFTDGGFQWAFQPNPSLSIRYTVKLTDKGEWFEIGEMSQDGKNWRKFHEMTLQKIK
ncbi:MAG: hypothetical protein WAV20_13485 [Blastocatellia bacterium]